MTWENLSEPEQQLRQEVLRYMGMGSVPQAEVEKRVCDGVDGAVAELRRQTRPRFVRKIYSLDFLNEADWSLSFGGVLTVRSRSLWINLRDCRETVFFAATLGAEADQLISRASRRDISRGLIMEAAATALLEAYCDACQMQLEEERNQKQETLRPRFSPGYGDFDIIHQKDMVHLLDTPRQIGMTLTGGGMLVPAKSVTAVMGIAPWTEKKTGSRQRCHIHGCEACGKTDCLYRRNK